LKSQDKEPPSGITPLLPMDFSDSRLRELSLLCSSLSLVERKALITLARSQSIPSLTESPIIFSKVACILNKLCQYPPFTDLYNTPLSIAGGVVLELLTSPILTGLIIVFALGSPYSPDEISTDKVVKDVRMLQSWRYNRYVDLDDPMPMRYKVPVSVKSGDFGMFEPDDEEGWSSPLELDY
jgi:hypothetical protein